VACHIARFKIEASARTREGIWSPGRPAEGQRSRTKKKSVHIEYFARERPAVARSSARCRTRTPGEMEARVREAQHRATN
jgi:hypothetical protein